MSDDPNHEMKLKFAEAWLYSPTNPLEAAMKVCRGDISNAIILSTHWVYDDVVLAHKEQLVREYGEDHFLPSKATLIHSVWARAQDCPDLKEFVGAVKLIADMQGMISKGNVNVTTNITTNKVMNVPVLITSNGTPANIDDWERAAMQQQQTLIAD